MSTPAQITANRVNAQLSTGPRSEEGKARSARNSLKHGLTARHTVLSNEDHTDFEELRGRLVAEHQPVGTQELLLVTQIVDAFWRLQRAKKIENAALENEIGWHDSATDDLTMLEVWRASSQELEKLRRYVASFERSYYRALSELRRIQTERRKSEPQRIARPPRIVIEQPDETGAASHCSLLDPQFSVVPSAGNGFVSQPDRCSPPATTNETPAAVVSSNSR